MHWSGSIWSKFHCGRLRAGNLVLLRGSLERNIAGCLDTLPRIVVLVFHVCWWGRSVSALLPITL